jgi:hypothetical protein
MSASLQSRPQASSASQLDISRYRGTDLAALLDFRAARHGAGSLRADRAYVEWLYRLDRVEEDASLFVCRTAGRIVGTEGLVRVGLKAGSEMLPAAWTIDFAVRQEPLQGLGLGLVGIGPAIARLARKDVSVRLALDVTPGALRIGRRAGWTPLGTVPLWVRVLDTGALLRARGASPLLLAAARAGQLALRGVDAYAARRARQQQVELVSTARFDERADDIWESASPHYPVVCRRDHRYLSWRFDRFTIPARYERFWLQRVGRTAGYAVLRIDDHRGVRAGFIIDYFCEPALMPALLASCLDVFRDAGAVVVYCLHLNASAGTSFRRLGFLRRSSGWPFIVYARGVSPAIHRSITTASNWFVTAGDSNVDHAGSPDAGTEPGPLPRSS